MFALFYVLTHTSYPFMTVQHFRSIIGSIIYNFVPLTLHLGLNLSLYAPSSAPNTYIWLIDYMCCIFLFICPLRQYWSYDSPNALLASQLAILYLVSLIWPFRNIKRACQLNMFPKVRILHSFLYPSTIQHLKRGTGQGAIK